MPVALEEHYSLPACLPTYPHYSLPTHLDTYLEVKIPYMVRSIIVPECLSLLRTIGPGEWRSEGGKEKEQF